MCLTSLRASVVSGTGTRVLGSLWRSVFDEDVCLFVESKFATTGLDGVWRAGRGVPWWVLGVRGGTWDYLTGRMVPFSVGSMGRYFKGSVHLLWERKLLASDVVLGVGGVGGVDVVGGVSY